MGKMKATRRGLKAQLKGARGALRTATAELIAARKAHKAERKRRKAWHKQAARYLDRVQELRSERDELYCKLNTDAQRYYKPNAPQPAPTTQVWQGTGVFERDGAPADVQDESKHVPNTGDEKVDVKLATAWAEGPEAVNFWYDHSLSQGAARREVEQERDQLRRKLETQSAELAVVREERAKLLAQVREQEEDQVQYGVWMEWTYPEPGEGWACAQGEPCVSSDPSTAAALAEKMGWAKGTRATVKAFNPAAAPSETTVARWVTSWEAFTPEILAKLDGLTRTLTEMRTKAPAGMTPEDIDGEGQDG